VETLHLIREQQFVISDGQPQWRKAEALPPSAEVIPSPYDREARYSRKRQTEWTGF
jgi:transposase